MTSRMQFEPATVRIQVGQSVRWENASAETHTVTDAPAQAGPAYSALPPGAAPFDSGYLGTSGAFTHRFTTPGFYRYYCVLHQFEGMVGTVVVEPRR